jgi:hypothetical protein
MLSHHEREANGCELLQAHLHLDEKNRSIKMALASGLVSGRS